MPFHHGGKILVRKEITVTFNYRHSHRKTRVKQLILKGVIGEIVSVHFKCLLDTRYEVRLFPMLALRQKQIRGTHGA